MAKKQVDSEVEQSEPDQSYKTKEWLEEEARLAREKAEQ